MTNSRDAIVLSLVRVYVVVALVVAATFSPPALSALPLLLLALFIYIRVRPPRQTISFSLNLYLFVTLPLLYEGIMNEGLASLMSLPLLGLVDVDIRKLASLHVFQDWRYKKRPSRTLLALAMIAAVSFAIAGLLGKMSIMIACAFLAGYVLFLLARVFRTMPSLPIEASTARHRVVAGQQISFTVPLRSRSGLARWLYVVPPYPWVGLKPTRTSLDQDEIELAVSLTPPLAGPSSISLTGFVLDRWGLMQQKIELEVAELHVIPRATYAVWLARRYLGASRAEGTVPTALSLSTSRRWMHSRRGIEYYGNRLYQPGDTLRSIDWKRSLKLDKIVVKEYDSPQATVALLLVNVTVGNADEADRLAFAWLTTAITLAREGIPTSLATYDHRSILATTGFLNPRSIVLRSLALSADITTWESPRKYLQAPDLVRVRATSRRLRVVGVESAAKLAELLEMEFKSVRQTATANPATKALARALRQAGTRPTVLFLSAKNHDVEALAMARYDLAARRYDSAQVSITGPTVDLPGRGVLSTS